MTTTDMEDQINDLVSSLKPHKDAGNCTALSMPAYDDYVIQRRESTRFVRARALDEVEAAKRQVAEAKARLAEARKDLKAICQPKAADLAASYQRTLNVQYQAAVRLGVPLKVGGKVAFELNGRIYY